MNRTAQSGEFRKRLARLAVQGVLAVPRAELLQLDAVGVVPAVLPGDVVPLLALRTRQGDLRTDVGRLGHGGVPSCSLTHGLVTAYQRRRLSRRHAKREPWRGSLRGSGGRT